MSSKTISCVSSFLPLSRTVDTIAQLQPNAVVWDDPLVLSRNDVADSAEQVTAWAEGLNLNQ